MQNENPEHLIKRYLDGTATPEEKALVDSWHLDEFRNSDNAPSMHKINETHQQMREVIMAHAQQPKVRPLWPKVAAAASIIIALSAGGYYALHKTPAQTANIAAIKPGTFRNDAVPGNKAILTLANGQQLTISSLPSGHITNTSAQKTANGALVYNQSDAAPDVYNTLTVPRGGGKHEITLADGTLAVLDAGSSIRFPIAFNSKERRVNITGQVYFEVVHNTKKPFYVTVNSQTIEDVGTHFNINAFDGDVKTTLLEGCIKVNNTLLKPGQQAVQQADGKFSVLSQVDEAEVIAWKNDLFKFGKNTSLETVMNQLSRWYDMDIVYNGAGKSYHFGGDMPRYSKLSDVLKILAYNGVQFSVDGKKIIVYQ